MRHQPQNGISFFLETYLPHENNMSLMRQKYLNIPVLHHIFLPSEADFKLKDFRGEVQNGNAHTIATNCGISQANQNSDKSSLTASHTMSQKGRHFKGVYDCGDFSCIPLETTASSASFSSLSACIPMHEAWGLTGRIRDLCVVTGP